MDASYTTGHDAAALDIEIAECRANERKWRIQAERLEEQRMLLLLEEHQDPETEEPTEGANDSSVGAEEADDDDEREEELRDVWQRIAMQYGVQYEPRKHQLEVLQAAMDGRDFIDVTGPGSGKTIAYLIAALYRGEKYAPATKPSPLSRSVSGPVHLVVSATTDLGKQQTKDLQQLLRDENAVAFVPRPEQIRKAAAADMDVDTKNAADDGDASAGNRESHNGDAAAADCSSLRFTFPVEEPEAKVLSPSSPIRVVVCLPEDLEKPRFRYFLQRLVSDGRLTQISLDEVHLVDQWSKFRGSYQRLGEHLAVVREGVVGPSTRHRRPTVVCLTGTASPRQARALSKALRLPPSSTGMFFSDLDRPHIAYHVMDLNGFDGTLPDVLRAGAERSVDYIISATKSIVFVASVRDAHSVAATLNTFNGSLGIKAFPFYSKLDGDADEAPNVLNREETLDEFEKEACGVLVSTTLGTHGLNFVTVDLVIHATIRNDVRTYYQDICRAGRVGNESISVQIIHPLLLTHASWSVDFGNGEEVAALRAMVDLVPFSRTCRRSATLRALGSSPPIPSSCADCSPLPSGKYPRAPPAARTGRARTTGTESLT